MAIDELVWAIAMLFIAINKLLLFCETACKIFCVNAACVGIRHVSDKALVVTGFGSLKNMAIMVGGVFPLWI